ncbi:MAG: hypothetical protein HOI95_30270, partial [Chromatiales bacterium]|nr:hypothetical protein [Chromatiales bacterium]
MAPSSGETKSMGLFDWLFGKKKKEKKGAKGSTGTRPAAHVTTPVAVPEEDEEDDFAQATTFVSRRLSPITQLAIKSLRGFLREKVMHYAWEIPDDACGNCKKFAGNGPYLVGDGLSGKAPVPARESPNCGCN